MVKKVELGEINRPIEKDEVEQFAHPVKQVKPLVAHRPGVNIDEETIEITSDVLDAPKPDWDSILRRWGFDPDVYEPVEPIKVSEWEAQVGEGVQKLYSYKAGVKTRPDVRDSSYQELVQEIKNFKAPKLKLPSGDDYFVVNLADWQLAKADGYGTIGTVNAILAMKFNVTARFKELRKIGRKLGTLVVVGLGDMIENCANNYTTQTYSVEMNRREQTRVCRRLIRDCLVEWSVHFNETIVAAVPGNHGENRNGGKQSYTTAGDNDDVAVFEQVADVLSFNPAFENVKFYLPENEVSVTLDIGTPTCFVHGHITQGTGTPQQKLKGWWQGQAFGDKGPGAAKLLISGHYHHLSIVEYGPKVHIQCPSMDGGSEWFENLTGLQARPGTVTFRLDESGYSDFQVI